MEKLEVKKPRNTFVPELIVAILSAALAVFIFIHYRDYHQKQKETTKQHKEVVAPTRNLNIQ